MFFVNKIIKKKIIFFIFLLLRFAFFLIDNNLRLRNDAASLRNKIQAMRDNDPVHYIKKKEQRISGLFINTLLILNYARHAGRKTKSKTQATVARRVCK